MKYLKTRPNGGGGIGHQWCNWQVGAALAEKWGYKFDHTPLISQRSGGDWDSFLNIGKGYESNINLREKELPDLNFGHFESKEKGKKNLKRIKKFIDNGKENTIYKFPYNKFPGIVSKDVSLLVGEMRKKFRKKNPVKNHNSFTVSFHLRRGDVDPEQNSNRWLSDEFYINWMKKIRSFLSESRVDNFEIYLFSTTGYYTKNFDNYPDFLNLRIDGNPFRDFKFMADSDVLFTGLSTYSVLASVYNVGFTFYSPFKELHYCSWMEDERNPRHEFYSNAFEGYSDKFEKWFVQIEKNS